MHYGRALLKVSDCFVVVSRIEVHHCAIEIVVFLVEDVFLVVIHLFFIHFVLTTLILRLRYRFVILEEDFMTGLFQLSV